MDDGSLDKKMMIIHSQIFNYKILHSLIKDNLHYSMLYLKYKEDDIV